MPCSPQWLRADRSASIINLYRQSIETIIPDYTSKIIIITNREAANGSICGVAIVDQNIPSPSQLIFRDGIRHPDLYLWDAWSYAQKDAIHLYCLAVNRIKEDGSALQPIERNSVPFHVRHFSSFDLGRSWRDEGCLMAPRVGEGMPDSKTIWSGSIEPLDANRELVAYTGLYEADEEHGFVQNIMLAISDGYKIKKRADQPIICPRRDWQKITQAGYYLAPLADVGHSDGERGGPIMAWRDPFVYIDNAKQVHLFWSAKVGPKRGAMAHALLRHDGQRFQLDKLYPPTLLPDGNTFTQFELPKIYCDENENTFYLIASTCNRLNEEQPDEEVDKTIRLYRSSALEGPWETWSPVGSALPGLDDLFGMTVLKPDFDRKRLLCIAPYTDAADDKLSLTFSKCFYINLDPVEVVFD